MSGPMKVQGDVKPSVVSLLESALTQARAGKIVSVLFVSELSDGKTSWGMASIDGAQLVPMVGELEFVKHELIERYNAGRR